MKCCAAILTVIAIVTTTGCGEPEPVARLRVVTAPGSLMQGRCGPVVLSWDMLRPLENLHGQPTVFVHLYDEPQGIVRAIDHPLGRPWRPGDQQRDEFLVCAQRSEMPTPVRAGRYFLRVGLYDNEWGYRWRLDAPGPLLAPRAYGVAQIVVYEGLTEREAAPANRTP